MEEVDRITQEQCEKELNWTEFTPAILAQSVERARCKVEAVGSIPADGLEEQSSST